MKKSWMLAALLVALPVTGAGAMKVDLFLQKADALEKKGMMALLSSDYKLLKGEVEAGAAALRKERLAAKAAGRPQAYCPAQGAPGLNSNEILKAFRTIPPAQRARVEVKDALRALLARKYPCRA
jgi:hypothetical protein